MPASTDADEANKCLEDVPAVTAQNPAAASIQASAAAPALQVAALVLKGTNRRLQQSVLESGAVSWCLSVLGLWT